jgi:hypothetical protein
MLGMTGRVGPFSDGGALASGVALIVKDRNRHSRVDWRRWRPVILAALVSMAAAVAGNAPAVAVAAPTAGWSEPILLHSIHSPQAVSCSSSSFCLVTIEFGAVITYRDGIWSSPENIAETSIFSAVSCTEDSGEPFCVVIGYNYLTFAHFTLTYQHGVWSSPETTAPGHFVVAVSCTNDAGKPFCAATEDEGDVMIYRNGKWSPPENVAGDSDLVSVSCIEGAGEPFCVAVGYSPMKSSSIAVIYRHGTWTLPEDLAGGNGGNAVSCGSESFCIFVEHLGNGQIYNGSSWSPPVGGMIGAFRDGISCTSATFCGGVAGVAAIYNGSSWTSLNIPGSGGLDSVSCVGELLCVAVSPEGLAVTYPIIPPEELKEKGTEEGGGGGSTANAGGSSNGGNGSTGASSASGSKGSGGSAGVISTRALPTAAIAFALPSAKQCVSKRRFTIHIRKLPGISWVSAVIKIDHKRVKAIGRTHITALVNLVGLPKGTFVLSITAKTSDGRSVTGTRTYHTCVPKRKSHYPAPKL